MEENSNTQSQEKIKKKKPAFFIVLFCLIFVISMLLDMYFFINDLWNVVGIICSLFFTLFSTIWLSVLFIQKQREKEAFLNHWMDETNKAQKALYLLNKKNHALQDEKINFLEKKIKEENENLEKTQKAVGKVLMNHFSEHANAMMNASGHIMNLQQEIKSNLNTIENVTKDEIEILFQRQNKIDKEEFDTLIQKVKQLSEDQSLKENGKLDLLLEKVEEKYETMHEQMNQLLSTIEEVKNLKDKDHFLVKETLQEETLEMSNETLGANTMEESRQQETVDDLLNTKEEQDIITISKEPEEASVLKEIDNDIIYNEIDLDDSGKQVSREELLESDFSNVEEKINKNQEEFPSSIIEEDNDNIKLVPLENEKNKEDEKAQPVKRGRKKKVEAEGISEINDINKLEEIASEETSEIVNESSESSGAEKLEVEQKEEKPPMPDLSDGNRKMTPEEIAALIANM